MGGGRHAFIRNKNTIEKRVLGRRQQKKGRQEEDEEEEDRRGKTEAREGGALRCFDKRSHVEKHSFSLTFTLSPSLSLHRTGGRVAVLGGGKK